MEMLKHPRAVGTPSPTTSSPHKAYRIEACENIPFDSESRSMGPTPHNKERVWRQSTQGKLSHRIRLEAAQSQVRCHPGVVAR